MFGFVIGKYFDHVTMTLADVEICAALKGYEGAPYSATQWCCDIGYCIPFTSSNICMSSACHMHWQINASLRSLHVLLHVRMRRRKASVT
jgi:hypothetical protein